MSLLTLVRLECFTYSAHVKPKTATQVLADLVEFVNDWIGALHLGDLGGSCSGVHITGGSKPWRRQMASIVPRIVALAMCLRCAIRQPAAVTPAPMRAEQAATSAVTRISVFVMVLSVPVRTTACVCRARAERWTRMPVSHVVAFLGLPALVLAQACQPSSVKKEASVGDHTTVPTSTPAPAAAGAPSTRDAHTSTPDQAERRKDPAALAPLAEDGTLVDLEVPKFRDAVVSVPLRATKPRPVVLALHGNYDRPEWQCEVMREITGAYPFILCPRGIPRRDAPKSENRWEYGSAQQVKAEIEAGLSAMKERFPGYVAEGPIVFTGFSLGAILGRSIVAADPERFSRVVFTEGGGEGWNFKKFKQGGGLRVLFGCAQRGCAAARRANAKTAERAGVEIRVADGGNIGHTYDGPVARAIQADWDWLVEGDERWVR